MTADLIFLLGHGGLVYYDGLAVLRHEAGRWLRSDSILMVILILALEAPYLLLYPRYTCIQFLLRSFYIGFALGLLDQILVGPYLIHFLRRPITILIGQISSHFTTSQLPRFVQTIGHSERVVVTIGRAVRIVVLDLRIESVPRHNRLDLFVTLFEDSI